MNNNWNNKNFINKHGAGHYCRECTERHEGCHSKCPKYKKAVKEAEEWNALVNKNRNKDKEIDCFKQSMVSKTKKIMRSYSK